MKKSKRENYKNFSLLVFIHFIDIDCYKYLSFRFLKDEKVLKKLFLFFIYFKNFKAWHQLSLITYNKFQGITSIF